MRSRHLLIHVSFSFLTVALASARFDMLKNSNHELLYSLRLDWGLMVPSAPWPDTSSAGHLQQDYWQAMHGRRVQAYLLSS